MSVENTIKNALEGAFLSYQQVVEVDPAENDWLITGVKQLPKKAVKEEKEKVVMGHSVPAGKSIIRRLEDLADSDFKRYMKAQEPAVIKHLDSRVEGICEALAIMKNTNRGIEYDAAIVRYVESKNDIDVEFVE